MPEILISLLIFLIVLVGLLYLVRYIPDPTIQIVTQAIIVIGALIWLVSHVRPLLHAFN